jgi:NTP pyrophosphatase (non-canonical NTP hydrolase)
MDFNTYQRESQKTAVYPKITNVDVLYPIVGLAGEVGELCNFIKKIVRSNVSTSSNLKEILLKDPQTLNTIKLELGDIQWYIAALCTELNIDLDDVALSNLKKLQNRYETNTIKEHN